MPQRQRTRAGDLRYRVRAERRHNAAAFSP